MTKVLLVGEARGRKEELFEHGFVGSSGAELARMLGQSQLGPDLDTKYPSELDMIRYWKQARETHGIEIANVFNTHPPDNNIELFFLSAKDGGDTALPPNRIKNAIKYVKPELSSHVKALWDKITASRPNLVVAFGNTACWAILEQSGITAIRGTVKKSQRLGVKVLPTYHPAAVMRQWNLRTVVLQDLEKAKREAEFAEIRRIERYVTVEPDLDEIRLWAALPAEFYAVDIETFQGQISMIGFARSRDDAIVVPFIDERSESWSYWKTVEDEIEAWKLCDTILRSSVPKVFQNGIYDLMFLLRAGLRPTRCEHDSMLLHHSLYPEMLKGLGFLGSIYSSEIDWKSMRKHGNNLKRDE